MTRIVDLTMPLDREVGRPRTELYGRFDVRAGFIGARSPEQWALLQRSAPVLPGADERYFGNVSYLALPCHAGTHVENARHVFADRPGIAELDLGAIVGPAAVLDLSAKRAGEAIAAADLERAGDHLRAGDIAVVRTDWPAKVIDRADYQRGMPFFAPDAAEWFLRREASAVACDCYNDLPHDRAGESPDGEPLPVHRRLLGAGVPLIENLVGLDALSEPRVLLIALPLLARGLEAAPARVVAIERPEALVAGV